MSRWDWDWEGRGEALLSPFRVCGQPTNFKAVIVIFLVLVAGLWTEMLSHAELST
jgi:hypothetical protein